MKMMERVVTYVENGWKSFDHSWIIMWENNTFGSFFKSWSIDQSASWAGFFDKIMKIARSTAIWFFELNRVKFKQTKRRQIIFSSQKSEPFERKNQVNTVQAIQKLASKIPHPARRLHLKFRYLLPKILENVATYHYHLPLASGVKRPKPKMSNECFISVVEAVEV